MGIKITFFNLNQLIMKNHQILVNVFVLSLILLTFNLTAQNEGHGWGKFDPGGTLPETCERALNEQTPSQRACTEALITANAVNVLSINDLERRDARLDTLIHGNGQDLLFINDKIIELGQASNCCIQINQGFVDKPIILNNSAVITINSTNSYFKVFRLGDKTDVLYNIDISLSKSLPDIRLNLPSGFSVKDAFKAVVTIEINGVDEFATVETKVGADEVIFKRLGNKKFSVSGGGIVIGGQLFYQNT